MYLLSVLDMWLHWLGSGVRRSPWTFLVSVNIFEWNGSISSRFTCAHVWHKTCENYPIVVIDVITDSFSSNHSLPLACPHLQSYSQSTYLVLSCTLLVKITAQHVSKGPSVLPVRIFFGSSKCLLLMLTHWHSTVHSLSAPAMVVSSALN